MKKLTKSNYENLPEIKRKKDEERKRQEALEKKERIAKYNKECKARSRAQLKKKREMMAEKANTASEIVDNVVVSVQPSNTTMTQSDAVTVLAKGVGSKSTNLEAHQIHNAN